MELQLVAYVDTTTKVWYLYGKLLGGYVELKVGELPGDVLDRYVIRIEHGPFKWRHHEVVSLVLIKAVAQLLYERILSDTKINELINIVYSIEFRFIWLTLCISSVEQTRTHGRNCSLCKRLSDNIIKSNKTKEWFSQIFSWFSMFSQISLPNFSVRKIIKLQN